MAAALHFTAAVGPTDVSNGGAAKEVTPTLRPTLLTAEKREQLQAFKQRGPPKRASYRRLVRFDDRT
jgi:hypothetical protein